MSLFFQKEKLYLTVKMASCSQSASYLTVIQILNSLGILYKATVKGARIETECLSSVFITI